MKRIKIRSNGITFLYEQNQSAGSVTAALFFKSGILYEREREYGVSRFVQELLFRRLRAFPPTVNAEQRFGRDHAAFFCEAPSDAALHAVRALAAVTEGDAFRPEEIEAVRDALLRECASFIPSQENDTERLYFDLPAYAAPPCGTEKTLRSITGTQLNRRRAEYCNLSNACFVLTGNFPDGDLKEIEAFLRGLPPQKHKSLNLKPQFPPDQFFRTSASDIFLPTEKDTGSIELLFEIDLCETKPVWAAMLRRLLAEPLTGAMQTALAKAKLTGDVQSQLRMYQGFAVLRFSCAVPHRELAAAVTQLAEATAVCKETLSAERLAPLLTYYTENRLYQHTTGTERAFELGLHNYILYTDDIVLPDRRSADTAAEQLIEAADNVLIPDNALFILYYNEKRGADLSAIRQSVTAARIRWFV